MNAPEKDTADTLARANERHQRGDLQEAALPRLLTAALAAA